MFQLLKRCVQDARYWFPSHTPKKSSKPEVRTSNLPELILNAFLHSMLVWFGLVFLFWGFCFVLCFCFSRKKKIGNWSYCLQIKYVNKMCTSINARKKSWSFYGYVRKVEKVSLIQSIESCQRTWKVVREKVNWFLSSGTIRHEVSMGVFLDNCMLLPAALHFDSHFHSCFHEQQKYSLFFSLTLC